MPASQAESLGLLLELIRTGGAVATLGIVLWLFYSGKILSQPVYEQMTESIVARVVEAITPTIQEGMQTAVGEALEDYFDDKSEKYFYGESRDG